MLVAEADNWFAQAITSLATLATALVPLIVWISTLQRKANINRQTIHTMWTGLLRRGAVEAVSKGLANYALVERIDQPMTLVPEVRAAYEPIAPALRHLRITKRPATDVELAMLIEAEFGTWLIKHICVPLGIFDAACLRMAIDICKEPGPVLAIPPPKG